MQEPARTSSTARAFVFLAKFVEFYYLKIFEKEVNNDLSVCVDECSPCGLSLSGDIKIYECHVIKR